MSVQSRWLPEAAVDIAPAIGTMRGVRRLALVLRPERDLADSLEQIRGWAASAGVELVGAEGEEQLPDEVIRRAETALATDCDVVLALGGDGTMLGARCGSPRRTESRSWESTSGGSAT